jgi:hypothetical protein
MPKISLLFFVSSGIPVRSMLPVLEYIGFNPRQLRHLAQNDIGDDILHFFLLERRCLN